MSVFKSCIFALVTEIDFNNLLHDNTQHNSTGLIGLVLIKFSIWRSVYAHAMNQTSDLLL